MKKNFALQTFFNKTLKSHYFIYTAIFALSALIVFNPFIFAEKSFIWNPDGTAQHFASFVYLGKYLREIAANFLNGSFVIPQWDFSIGLGGDILTSLHYYSFGDLLDLLSVFIPVKHAALGYTLIMVLRYYLAGLSFTALCKYKKHSAAGAVSASLIYVFNYYSMYLALRHPSFLNPLIYFPLIILGIEMIFDKKKPYLFIFMIFVSAASSFYFFYVISLFTVLYIFIRLFFAYKKEFFKNSFFAFLKFGGGYLLGVLMAAVVFLPVVSVFTGSARSGVEYELTAFFKPEYYNQLIASFASARAPYNGTYFGFTALSFAAVFMLFSKMRRTGESLFLKISVILLAVMTAFPIFSKIINGFSYVTNRWSWIFGLLVAYIFSFVYSEMKNITGKQLSVVFAGSIFYMIFVVYKPSTQRNSNFVCMALFFIFTAILLIFWLIQTKGRENDKKNAGKAFKYVVLVVSIVSVYANSYYTFDPNAVGFTNEFMDYPHAADYACNNGFKPIKKLQSTSAAIERYETQTTDLGDYNNAMLNKTYGTVSYLSLTDGLVNNFQKELGLVANNFSLIESSNGDPFIEAFENVKYYAPLHQNDGDYGFSKTPVTTIKSSASRSKNTTYYVLENENYIPFGFTYKNVISENDYLALNMAEKRVSLLDSIVINDTDDFVNSETDSTSVKCTTAPCELTETEGVYYASNNRIYVSQGCSIKIKTKTTPNSQVYCLLKNLRYIPTTEEELFNAVENMDVDDYTPEQIEKLEKIRKDTKLPRNKWMGVYANGKNCRFNLTHSSYDYYSGIVDFTANLAYSEDSITEITLSLSPGLYQYDDIIAVSVDMSDFRNTVSRRSQDTLRSLKIETDKISGEITASEDEFLFLSIPYSKYWTATVDGAKVETYRANTAFTAIELEKGEHTVELQYSNTIIKYSAVLTAAGFLGFLAVIIYNERKSRQAIWIDCE